LGSKVSGTDCRLRGKQQGVSGVVGLDGPVHNMMKGE
jgi:hypothetical protein